MLPPHSNGVSPLQESARVGNFLENKGGPGSSLWAICRLHGASVLRLSIGAPLIPGGFHGGHLPILPIAWVSKSTWYSYHFERYRL